MARTAVAERPRADETASGLPAWEVRELPEPPRPKGLQWFGVVGPGVIVLGAAIGSGEFPLGPAAFIQYGLVVLWITGVATILQTVAALAGLRTAFVGERDDYPDIFPAPEIVASDLRSASERIVAVRNT